MENNFYSGTRVIFPKTKGLKYVLQTKDKRWVSKAELLKDPKYTNKKSIEKEFTGVVREAKLFAYKEANKWVKRFKDEGLEISLVDIDNIRFK